MQQQNEEKKQVEKLPKLLRRVGFPRISAEV